MRQHLGEYEDHYDSSELIGEERDEEYYERPQRRWPAGLLTVGAMAVFAGGLYFAYFQGTHHPAAAPTADGVPLIRADDRPTKVKPDQPGGMAVPDQNVSLYNEKPGGTPVEKLLPGPEQPMPRPAAPPKEATAAPPPIPAPVSPDASAPAVASPPPADQQTAAAPKPAKPTAQAKPAAAAKDTAAKQAAAILGASTIAATAPKAGGGPVRVQLGSLRSADAAKEEWARLKREQPELLGKLSAIAVKADLGDKGIYYRVEAGPLPDGAAAERLCGELRQRKLGCSLVR
ncbi:MAG TPA: SPOR domain-containing protein [Stellaceae bacterium]